MQSFTAEHPPRLTLLLGYAGLLPFIGGVWARMADAIGLAP